jgi:hypothetical protein
VLEASPLLVLDPRAFFPEPLGQVRLPDVRGFDDVVVDTDDLRKLAHFTDVSVRFT